MMPKRYDCDKPVTFNSAVDYDLPRELMERDDDNADLLELDEYDYSFITATEEELLIMFSEWRNKGFKILQVGT